jgi:hypothetical protein
MAVLPPVSGWFFKKFPWSRNADAELIEAAEVPGVENQLVRPVAPRAQRSGRRRDQRRLGHLAHTRDLVRRGRSHLRRGQRQYRERFAGEGQKLDFVRRALVVNHDDGADIARFKAVAREVFRQYGCNVLFNIHSRRRSVRRTGRAEACSSFG